VTTERFSDIRPSWIAFGWFIAAAVASLLIMAFVVLGLVTWDTLDTGGLWTAVAILVGFVVGGFFAGVRSGTAPVLHGLGIGLFSLVIYFLANLLAGEPTGVTAWGGLPPLQAAGLLTLQTAAAVVGARLGVRWDLR
jgi:hypothetical protein